METSNSANYQVYDDPMTENSFTLLSSLEEANPPGLLTDPEQANQGHPDFSEWVTAFINESMVSDSDGDIPSLMDPASSSSRDNEEVITREDVIDAGLSVPGSMRDIGYDPLPYDSGIDLEHELYEWRDHIDFPVVSDNGHPSFLSLTSSSSQAAKEANTSESSKANLLGSIPSDISNYKSPPSSLGVDAGNKALSVGPMSAGAGEATTSPEDPNCHSGVQSTESRDRSARGTGPSDDEEPGILHVEIPTCDGRQETPETIVLHYNRKDDCEAPNLQQTAPRKHEETVPRASVLSSLIDGPESEPPTRNPGHTALPTHIPSHMIGDFGKGNGKEGTPRYRKRQREAEKRGSDSPSASSSTENVEVIDLTSHDDANDPISVERLHERQSSHADGPPPKKRPSKRSSKKRQHRRQLERVKSKQQAGPFLEMPRDGGELREFSITDLVLPVSFSFCEGYWKGPGLGLKLNDEEIRKRFSEDWSETTVKTMPSTTRWPVCLKWNPVSDVFEGEDYCHNVKYYVTRGVMNKKLRGEY